MQFTPQTMDKLQNAAGLGFENGHHHRLATAIEDGDHNRFLPCLIGRDRESVRFYVRWR
jgi:hypothetical protein